MNAQDDNLVCFNCETPAFLTTTVEEQDIPYGTEGKSFWARFPVHHCSQCGESFLSHVGMEARDAAQRTFEATLSR